MGIQSCSTVHNQADFQRICQPHIPDSTKEEFVLLYALNNKAQKVH